MTLVHEVTGTGPAVVLLHSSACDRRMWADQVAPLVDAGCQVVTFDFRGFGETALSESYSDAEDVLELLDELNIVSALLVGASFGGRVAQEIAARWPERVSGLVLLCPGSPGAVPSPNMVAFAAREESLLAEKDIDGMAELYGETWLGPEADETAKQAVRAMRRHSCEVQVAFGEEPESESVPVDLSAIAVPTLVVAGAHDLEHFRRLAVTVAGKIPGARHLELGWAGHLPNLERPAEITALLLANIRVR